jgi:hypothetical protein
MFGDYAGFLCTNDTKGPNISNSNAFPNNWEGTNFLFPVRCVCDMTATEWFAANGGSRYLKNTPQGLVWAKIAKVAETNSYNDLDDKPTIPSKTSDLQNDAGFITENDLPTQRFLPTVTSSDNGKILIVDNGAWAAHSVPVADSVLYPNSNN